MTSHCHGCDSIQPNVRTFAVQFENKATPDTVRYCPECAELAEMNFNGETVSIRPADPTPSSRAAIWGLVGAIGGAS
jgi:hypothetical protein